MNTHTFFRKLFTQLILGSLLIFGLQAEERNPTPEPETSGEKLTVLITGANRGLGLALSKQFAADNYHVIGTARSPGKAVALKEIAAEVLPLDVTSEESIKALAKSLEGRPIDILVNNAGYFGPTLSVGKTAVLKDLTRSEVLDTFAVNAAGPIFVTQGLLPNLDASKSPKVIIISSRSGILTGKPRRANAYGYRISKTAVNRAVRILAVDPSLKDFIVVAIAPGHNQTDMGGENAKLTADESMKQVKHRIEELTKKHHGGFWYYNGKELPW